MKELNYILEAVKSLKADLRKTQHDKDYICDGLGI